jgi:undecaprenyl pyrophosphate phosphatase UppP
MGLMVKVCGILKKMIILEKIFSQKPRNIKNVKELSVPKSGLIGVAQSISVIPGVSRAAGWHV